MAANKKPRKRYVQKPHQLPVTIRFNADDERTLQLIPHQELALMTDGSGTSQSWHTITSRLNVGMHLALQTFSKPEQEVMAHALDAICDVRGRFKRVGKYGVSGDEKMRIGAGLVLTDEMQKASTRREMRDVVKFVYNQMEAA